MKKHWLATMVLMTVMMIGLTLPSVVSAAEISVAEGAAEPAAQSNLVEGNWKYIKNSDGTVTLTGYVENVTGGTVNIPSKIAGRKVTIIGENAFRGFSAKNIVIPNTVKTLGVGAFYWCNMESVTIPNSVTSISKNAFAGCKRLTNIVLPEKITVLEEYVFRGCSELKSITLPSGLKTINNYALTECLELQELHLPETVTYIGEGAFRACMDLESITIPKGVKNIAPYTFDSCQELKRINLPEGIESIGEGALHTCTKIGSITIPSTVKTIGPEVFTNMQSLAKVTFGSMAPVMDANAFAEVEVNAYFPQGSTAWTADKLQNYGGTVTWAAYKESRDEYGNMLQSVVLPDNTISVVGYSGELVSTTLGVPAAIGGIPVTSVGRGAFADADKLTKIVIAESVQNIGKSAFLSCDNLVSINIPKAVTEIAPYTFAYSKKLPTVVLSENLKLIDDSAFSDCVGLTHMIIPASVGIIGESAFSGCGRLKQLILNEGLIMIDRFAFYQCEALQAVEFPDTLTTLGACSFGFCGEINKVVIPKKVTGIGSNAFYDCYKLRTVIFEGSAFEVFETNRYGNEIFGMVHTNVYYPADDDSWTDEFIKPLGYDGYTNWISYDSEIPFVDIKESDFYFEPVLWALEKNITAGVSEYLFMPTQACTRGQVVTFLWRAMGEEEPTVTSHAFVDVSDSAYYSKAVLWAVENGITYGVDSTHFKPEATVTRGEFVTFLYRVFDKPEYTGQNPFSDIKQEAYYYDAVLWAYENKIAYGYFADLFAPWAQCTRGEVVTFLYRGLYEKPLPVEPIMMSIDTAEACGAYAGDQDEFPVFTDGNKEKWYDRLTWPWYGKTFYDTLCEGTDNDGIKDCFIDWKSSGVAGQIRVSEMKENGEIVESVVPVIKLHGEIFGSGTGEEVILDDFFVDFESKANILAESFQAFRFDHPEVFWFNDTLNFVVSDLKWEYYSEDQPGILRGSLYLILEMESELTSSHMRYEKYQDVTALKQAIAARDTQIDKIVNAAASLDKLSQLEYFHDWLIMNNEINTNVHSDEDASAMVQSYPEAFECLAALYGNTGAKGPTRPSYAYAYKVLCDKVGIPCVITIGNKAENSDEDFHFWNYVKLERAWYAVDAACDDPSGGVSGAASGLEKDEFFMIGKNTEVATANGTMTFSQSHEVTNILTENDIRYMNGPILSDEKYSCAIESIVLTVSKDTFYADFEELPTVTADVVTAEGVTDEPEFTWYVRTSDGMLKEIEGENSYIVNLPEDEYSGTFVVVVEVTVGNVSRSDQIHINAIKFIDIMESYYYYDAVLWALEHKITSGYTYELFEPNMACTRGQMVTFMWRAAGCPEAENREISFKDVDANAYYYEAVLWAVENNITAGFTKEQFAPESPITRGQLVTFLWRANPDEKVEDEEDGSDGVEHTNLKEDVKSLFEDVEDSAYYYDAVYWAVENDITSGYNPTIFAPEDVATRAQIVTFLWRADKNLTSKQNVL